MFNSLFSYEIVIVSVEKKPKIRMKTRQLATTARKSARTIFP